MERQLTIPVYDRVIAILRETSDGDNLAPRDLALTELAINKNLSSAGEDAFEKLYNDVCVTRSYDKRKVWFLGFENVTRDRAGYIQWKGVTIEHFTFANGDRAREAAAELQASCQTMERFGVAVESWASYFDWLSIMRPVRELPGGLMQVDGIEAFLRLVGHESLPRNEGYITDRRRTAEDALQIVASSLQAARATHLACHIWYERGCDAMLSLTFDLGGQSGQYCHDAMRASIVEARDLEAVKLPQTAVITKGDQPRFGMLFASGMVPRTAERIDPFIRLIHILDDLAKVG